MKIQLIGYTPTQKLNTSLDVDYTTLNKPNSLDEYDINIINLQNENIWRNNPSSKTSINYISDFRSLNTMISNSNKAKNIVALPQNYIFKYWYDSISYGNKGYQEAIQLKDMLFELTHEILPKLTSISFNNILCYENTNTICGGDVFSAAFYFHSTCSALSLSNRSEKKTTILLDSVIYTTLDICSQEVKLEKFLSGIKVLTTRESFPEWLYEVTFNDDTEQKRIVEWNNEKIQSLQKEIETATQCLENNMHYKSILFANGDELVKVVFEILEKILVYDLSDFKDELKEDFLIKKEDIIFIGEIKGVTSNVKNEHISQVEVHYQSYADKLQEDDITENVKQLLIINPFRTKELSLREEIHENQINLAKRNGCLIITTETLLYVFEKFLKNEFSTEYIINTFSNNEGVLTKEMLNI
ncbi:MAG: hypothetical protein IKB93_08325 [Clostridia bacterium]|nr:hypothetical protein [Clostridia bacterium]